MVCQNISMWKIQALLSYIVSNDRFTVQFQVMTKIVEMKNSKFWNWSLLNIFNDDGSFCRLIDSSKSSSLEFAVHKILFCNVYFWLGKWLISQRISCGRARADFCIAQILALFQRFLFSKIYLIQNKIVPDTPFNQWVN